MLSIWMEVVPVHLSTMRFLSTILLITGMIINYKPVSLVSISILMLFCCSPGDPAYRCERQVSTILCFHDPQCLEPSCNDHGTCFQGECTCNSPWVGEDCGHLNCSLVNCSNHGNCTGGTATL